MMTDRAYKALLLSGLIIGLLAVNAAIVGKERLLREGTPVYLELAPVDPRSLMQGDYMALNYRVADQVRSALPRAEDSPVWLPELAPADGRIVIRLDDRDIGHFIRLDDGSPLEPGEILMRFRVRAGNLKFASNAWFFEEGTAERYQEARYGKFRVADDGELLLTGLHDSALQPLGPP